MTNFYFNKIRLIYSVLYINFFLKSARKINKFKNDIVTDPQQIHSNVHCS